MAEEEIKKGKGRPRKVEGEPTAGYMKLKGSYEGWGGKREGAGRFAKGADAPLTAQATFRVTEDTARRIKALREITAQDDKPFNRMFELWVAEFAQDYGIE